MRTLLVALLLLGVPSAAAAGPALGLRLGYDVSSGDAAKGTPMSEVAKSDVPIQLDLLWRFGPSFSLGVYYAYGFGQISSGVASRCDALGADCSAWTMRAGVELHYAFADLSKRYAPWIGTGIGYAWVRDNVSLGGLSAREDWSGWELLNLEGGVDAKVAPKLSVGPYLSVHWAQYGSLDGYGVVNKSFHRWLGFGVRGTWDF